MNLTPHWTTARMDPTKCAIMCRCPREFFFSAWLGWHPDHDSHHLLVGQCFHSAMEVLLKEKNLAKAQATYLNEWQRKGSDNIDLGNKSPENMVLALKEYQETYCTDRWAIDNDFVEIPGMVSLSDDRVLYINIDVIITDMADRKLYIVDHKTASAEDRLFTDKWQLSFQMSAYVHALFCMVPESLIGGAIVNAIVLRKPATARGKGNGFQRAILHRNKEDMSAWWADAMAIFDDLERWTEQIQHESASTDYMYAFPRRTWNCERYARMCPYHGICTGCGNPLRLVEANVVPNGFRLGWWNPEGHEETAVLEPPMEEASNETK